MGVWVGSGMNRRILVAVKIADQSHYPGLRIDVTDCTDRKIEVLSESVMLGLDENVWRVEVVSE